MWRRPADLPNATCHCPRGSDTTATNPRLDTRRTDKHSSRLATRSKTTPPRIVAVDDGAIYDTEHDGQTDDAKYEESAGSPGAAENVCQGNPTTFVAHPAAEWNEKETSRECGEMKG